MATIIEIHPTTDRENAEHYLLFQITGNPGLISYYDDFLVTLQSLLQSSSSNKIFHVYGRSLAGFEDHNAHEPAEYPEILGNQAPPYNLGQQITILRSFLFQQRINSGPQKGQPYAGVILIGHSVGSYILLELLRQSKLKTSDPNLDCRDVNIMAGICLFPTVTHIAKSPSGLKISMLFRIPNFPRIASLLANMLIFPLPRVLLKILVRLVTRMPDDASETTTRFLMSKTGIWQALHLAKDEMETIQEDKWDEEIWGVENPKGGSLVPKLIFYFGQNDHWVADHTRDDLIAARAHVEGDARSKPLMFIDQDGVPHGFCIDHSEIMAEKVKVWIDDIVEST